LRDEKQAQQSSSYEEHRYTITEKCNWEKARNDQQRLLILLRIKGWIWTQMRKGKKLRM